MPVANVCSRVCSCCYPTSVINCHSPVVVFLSAALHIRSRSSKCAGRAAPRRHPPPPLTNRRL
eukprot:6202744-Pleurochrysis_carterae.AAC.4